MRIVPAAARAASRELRRWLDDVEAFWTRELDAFKAHAERTRGKGKGRR